MYSYVVIIIGIITASFSGCASTGQGVLLGAGSGAAVGAGVGYAADSNGGRGALIGAGVGAVTGGLVGFIIQKIRESSSPVPSIGAPQKNDLYPFLTKPDLRTLYVPDQIEGERFIEGHRVFIIDKNSTWTK